MYKNPEASNLDKAVSIISYFTMGTAGLIWIIAAYFLKKKPDFFLMYNLLQSMLVSILFALFNLLIGLFLQITAVIPFLSRLSLNISMFLQSRITILGLSFNKIEIVVFMLLIYITAGILLGRIFYVPLLTKAMKMILHSYR